MLYTPTMEAKLLYWDIYEISTENSEVNGVMLRGRIRKVGLNKGINVLVENTQDKVNGVRFAVFNDDDAEIITTYVHEKIPDASIRLIVRSIANPVLSKLKVNTESRYEL